VRCANAFPICRTLCFSAALLAAACNRSASVPAGRVVEAYIPNSGAVGFDLTPIPSPPGTSQWKATYSSKGKTAIFRIELGAAKISRDEGPADFTIKSGEGRFVAEAGSDATAFLSDLKTALEAKTLPAKVRRATSVPFTFANIGENLSQAPGGGLNVKPPGNWTAIKLFLGEDEQECQVFFNVNSAIGKGEFSIKDPDYGDLLLAQFAKVL
jgi:hypothetical protein